MSEQVQSIIAIKAKGRRPTRFNKCQHVKRDGAICGQPSARELCFYHEYLEHHPELYPNRGKKSHQCAYVTKKNTPCKRKTTNEYCFRHKWLQSQGTCP